MELDDRALPLTLRQLGIWPARETGHSGAEGPLRQFVRIEAMGDFDLLKDAFSKSLRKAAPLKTAFLAIHGHGYEGAIAYSDAEPAFSQVSCSRHRPQQAGETASSIRRAPMPFHVPPLKFSLFRTRPGRPSDCNYLFGNRLIEMGIISTSNFRHSDRDANGRIGSIKLFHQANWIRTRSQPHRVRRGERRG